MNHNNLKFGRKAQLCAIFWCFLTVGMLPVFAQSTAVGDPGPSNGWDSQNAVSARSSSNHVQHDTNHLIDGSGMDPGGSLCGNSGLYMSDSLTESKSNPHGGTVEGSHWVEFQFDKNYRLGEMWIWNYAGRAAEYDWRMCGFRDVTIQYSKTGGERPEEWQTVFEGEIPMAESPAPDFLAEVSLIVDFQGAEAKFVVITAADAPGHNWVRSEDAYVDAAENAGLSEVRFYLSQEAPPKQ